MDKHDQTAAAPAKKSLTREILGWAWILPAAFLANLVIQNYAFAHTEGRSISKQATL